jgi:NADPH:quinone reductase-like Zn-dependent oxidoreductase
MGFVSMAHVPSVLMRAFTLDSFDEPPRLRDDLGAADMGPNEVLVRVHTSSANPADAAIATGMLKGMAEYEFPVTLGRDYAGVVEDVGSAVKGYSAGDEVYGFILHANPTVHDGSWADYVVVPEDMSIARKPAGVDRPIAGAAPLAALAALDAFDALELSESATVLVIGANGGVGSVFVQLAAAAGATVIAPSLAEDRDYLQELGAGEIIDREADVAAYVREHHSEGADGLLDLVSFEPDASVLKPGGRLASPLGAAGEGPGRTNVMASPTTSNLERLGQLLAAGSLRIPIQRTYPLEQANAALESLASAHTQGKLAIKIA